MKIKNPKLLIFCIVITFLAGAIGSVATTPSIPTWYATLNKPALNPPNYIFGPVWTTLYFLIGISFYLYLTNKRRNDKLGVFLFYIQLLLNSLWSILFFGLKSPTLALYEIIIFWFVIIATAIHFYKVNRISGIIFIPYILWVSFATYLTYSILLLN